MAMSNKTMFDHLDDLLLDYRSEYLTYQQILEDYQGHPFGPLDTVQGNDNWSQLHEAYKKMKKILKAKGCNFDYSNGRDAKKGFRYPSELDNPMGEERSQHRKLRTEQLTRLIEHSAGLLPRTWMNDLLNEMQMLDQAEGKMVIIDFDHATQLEHMEHVPTLYDAIEHRRVLRFSYRPKYDQEQVPLLFHPYYLKEYNQRWFVFGKATTPEGQPLPYSLCGIDRIEGKIMVVDGVDYQPMKEPQSASRHFSDIVGVTRKNGKPQRIEIAANDRQTFYRILTKKLHRSQRTLAYPDDAERGRFVITVIPNPELDTLLMSFGPDIEVLSPADYRQSFIARVLRMGEMYSR